MPRKSRAGISNDASLWPIVRSYDRQIAEVETGVEIVATAFEKRINELEHTKLVLKEKRAVYLVHKDGFEEIFEIAFGLTKNLPGYGVPVDWTVVDWCCGSRLQTVCLTNENKNFEPPKPTCPSACWEMFVALLREWRRERDSNP